MPYKIVGIGEVLWDVFPHSRKLGGAPANFAYFVKKLGQDGLVVSKVGDDFLGKEIMDSLFKLGLAGDFIQIDYKHPTGTVDVKIDDNGQPDYIISKNAAWDFLEFSDRWKKLAKEADVICFGTLAQRSLKSRRTIIDFLKMARSSTIKVFDINLRQNFYSLKTISQSLELATILKLNTEELGILKNLMGYSSEKNDINFCRRLMNEYGIKLVCLTMGEDGSLLMDESDYYDHPGYKVSVADTVGAGDAFTAAMVIQYLEGRTLEEMSNSANRLGSLVSAHTGPTPVLDEEIKELFINKTGYIPIN
ncbi:MAG: carbohydrate kinase [Actinobacteria bacterium]|nr:carbohydrate kinase [Actinomycetota bacterium]